MEINQYNHESIKRLMLGFIDNSMALQLIGIKNPLCSDLRYLLRNEACQLIDRLYNKYLDDMIDGLQKAEKK